MSNLAQLIAANSKSIGKAIKAKVNHFAAALATLTKDEQAIINKQVAEMNPELRKLFNGTQLVLLQAGENQLSGTPYVTIKDASNPFGSGALGLNVSGPCEFAGNKGRISFSFTLDNSKDATRAKLAAAIKKSKGGKDE